MRATSGEAEAAPSAAAAAAAATATTGTSVLRGSLWNTASRLIPQAYSLGISVAAARFLGPDGMGRQSFIAFIELSSAQLFTGGLSLALMRNIGEALGAGQGRAVRGLLRWAWGVQVIGALIGAAALIVPGALGATPRAAWALAGVAAAMAIMHTVPSAVLIGAQRWREASIAGLVTGAVAVPSVIAVLAAGGGIAGMFGVEAAVGALNLIWTGVLAQRTTRQVAPESGPYEQLRRKTIRFTAGTSLSVIVTYIVWKRSEFFFLSHYSNNTEIAFYSIAFAGMAALTMIPETLATTMAPAFATLFGAGESERIRTGFGRALRLMSLATLPLTAAALALGPRAIEVVYGSSYNGAGSALRLLSLGFPLVPLVSVSNALLLGIGRIRAPVVAGIAAAVVNIALDFALIPHHAANGAAVANTVAQATMSTWLIVYGWRRVGGVRLEAGALLRTAVASAAGGAAAAGVVAALGGLAGLVLGLAAGLVVFAALARLLKILPADDAAWLAQALGARFGGVLVAIGRRSGAEGGRR